MNCACDLGEWCGCEVNIAPPLYINGRGAARYKVTEGDDDLAPHLSPEQVAACAHIRTFRGGCVKCGDPCF